MCRWMAYSGQTIPLDLLLLRAQHNLIDQSLTSRSAETPTNGDGFGVGWYGSRTKPGLFRSIRPAWNDANLRYLAEYIDTHLFLAHVRATSLATVQETNCHPFQFKQWLFVHNGEILEIERFRRALLMSIEPELFNHVQGTTDSEVMFYLALTFGLEEDPIGGLQRMVGFIEQTARKHEIPEPVWMTVGVSDGKSIWAARYATDNEAPTLFVSRDQKDLDRIEPAITKTLGPNARVVVSEPIGKFEELWQEVPQATSITIHGSELTMHPFVPQFDFSA